MPSALSLALYCTPSSQTGAFEADKEGDPCRNYAFQAWHLLHAFFNAEILLVYSPVTSANPLPEP